MSRRHVFIVWLVAATAAAAVPSIAGAELHATDDSSATVDRFSVTFTETFDTPIPECFVPDLVGTTINTFTVTGQSVETSSGVSNVHGTVEGSFHLEFPNGMYADSTVDITHFSFHANRTVVVNTQVERNPYTIYNADGTPFVEVVIHAGGHITFRDLNGDGEPQEEEISASVDRFFFTCH